MSTDEKYKQFRNYMTSELGITRQDIEAWTRQAVANEIEKRLDKLDLPKMVDTALHGHIAAAIRSAVDGATSYDMGAALRRDIAATLADRLTISVAKAPA